MAETRIKWSDIVKAARETAEELNGKDWVNAGIKARHILFDLADEHERLGAEVARWEHTAGELQRLLELAIVDRDRYAGEAKRLKAEVHRLKAELAEARSARIPGP